jgi:hypothetical protein
VSMGTHMLDKPDQYYWTLLSHLIISIRSQLWQNTGSNWVIVLFWTIAESWPRNPYLGKQKKSNSTQT